MPNISIGLPVMKPPIPDRAPVIDGVCWGWKVCFNQFRRV